MENNQKNIFGINLIVFFALLAFGCENFAEEVPDAPKRPIEFAVTAYVSPPRYVEVYVDRTRPVFPEKKIIFDDDWFKQCTVTIKSGNQQADLRIDSFAETDYGRFIFDSASVGSFGLLPGQLVELSVQHPLLNTATAQTIIPEAHDLSPTFEYNLSTSQGDEYQTIKAYSFNLSVSDPSTEANAYQLFNIQTTTGLNIGDFSTVPVSDENKNGEKISLIGGFNSVFVGNQTDSVVIYYLLLNQDYYQNELAMQRNIDGGGFGEPVTMYSNVKGGVGVFSAFLRYQYKFLPKP